jgi:hypothetical protein
VPNIPHDKAMIDERSPQPMGKKRDIRKNNKIEIQMKDQYENKSKIKNSFLP